MQLNDLGVPDLQDTPELDSLLGAAPWRGSVPAGGKHWVLWESNRDGFCFFSLSFLLYWSSKIQQRSPTFHARDLGVAHICSQVTLSSFTHTGTQARSKQKTEHSLSLSEGLASVLPNSCYQ